MKYKIGQIYFWYSNEDLFGKAITYYNQREFPNNEWLPTHTGIIVDIREDAVLIAEAGPKGFLVDDNWYDKKWLDNKIETGYCKIGECKEVLKDVYNNAHKYEGIGYGWLDILLIGLYYYTGISLGLTGKNKIICSEAVNYVIYDSTKSINFSGEFGISPDQITPAHIFLSQQVNIL